MIRYSLQQFLDPAGAAVPAAFPEGPAPARMVEQNAAKALEISDYAYVLELGVNRFEGTGEAIRNDERIRGLYLGH